MCPSPLPQGMVYPSLVEKLSDTGVYPGVTCESFPPRLEQDFIRFPGNLQTKAVLILVKVSDL